MSSMNEPIEGNWYELPSGEIFTVITVDEDEGIMEIQYADASIEEVELDNWDDLGVTPIDPPDEWSGSYEDFDDEDDNEDEDKEVDDDEFNFNPNDIEDK
ncbi:MAG: hypothetical protein EYX74_06360 [Desulfobulbaceae bacterium]|nr:MAG: hypothetical protein EYX74_06360 [Desulfobulbaceae bacterium]